MDTELKFWPAFFRGFLVMAGLALTGIDYTFLKLLILDPSGFALISFIIYTAITVTFIALGVNGLRQINIKDEGVIVKFFSGLFKMKRQRVISINKAFLSNRIGTYPSIIVELENGNKYEISEFETKNFDEVKTLLIKKFPSNNNLNSSEY